MLAAMLALDFPTELGAPGQQLFCQQDNCPAISTMDMYVCDIYFPSILCMSDQSKDISCYYWGSMQVQTAY